MDVCMDHRGAEFADLVLRCCAPCSMFRTKQPVIIYPSSGIGAWKPRS
jgi:alanine-glyoxylate transaminase/serine-glyoxylate transaminase/serine-pyruvate transaminase